MQDVEIESDIQLARKEGEELLESFPGAFFAVRKRVTSMDASIARLEAIACDPDLARRNPKSIAAIMRLEQTIQRALYMQMAIQVKAALAVAKCGGFARKTNTAPLSEAA